MTVRSALLITGRKTGFSCCLHAGASPKINRILMWAPDPDPALEALHCCGPNSDCRGLWPVIEEREVNHER